MPENESGLGQKQVGFSPTHCAHHVPLAYIAHLQPRAASSVHHDWSTQGVQAGGRASADRGQGGS